MNKKKSRILALFVSACLSTTMFMTGFVVIVDAAGVIYVPDPTGTPETDWAYIQDALDMMGPGDTIMLGEGTYKVHRPLQKTGFHGAIVGEGMDETVIEAVRDSYGMPFVAGHYEVYDGASGPGSEDYVAILFQFGSPENSLCVSDLTVVVNEEEVAEYSYTKIGEDIFPWDFNGPYLNSFFDISLADNCDTTFKDVKMVGIPNVDVWNPRFGVGIWYSNGGTHTVTRCEFVDVGRFAYGTWSLYDANVKVYRNSFEGGMAGFQTTFCSGLNAMVCGNSFYQLSFPATPHYCLDASHVKIFYNTMTDGEGAIWMNQWTDVYEGPTVIAHGNYIDIREGSWFGGVEVWDQMFEEAAKSKWVVTHNQIYSDDFLAPYGPLCFNGVHGAVVANNRFMGAGPAAMFIGTFLDYLTDEGNEIINNKVYQFEVGPGFWDAIDYFEPIPGLAHIVLGPYSNNNLVKLRAMFDTVLDLGTDNEIVTPRRCFGCGIWK